MTVLSNSLRKRAMELGLAHADVAKRAGLSEQRFGNYAAGTREPDLQTLVRIAQALETSPNELLGFEGPEPEPVDRRKLLKRISDAAGRLRDQDLPSVLIQIEALTKAFSR